MKSDRATSQYLLRLVPVAHCAKQVRLITCMWVPDPPVMDVLSLRERREKPFQILADSSVN